MYFSPAPSAPPTFVNTSEVTSSSITVQWEPVDCIHHNGDITGYSVRYGVQESGSTQTLLISGGATAEIVISGLDSVTNYSIEVAAVNSAGIGPYSNLIYSSTLCKLFFILWSKVRTILFQLHFLRLDFSWTSIDYCGFQSSYHHIHNLDWYWVSSGQLWGDVGERYLRRVSYCRRGHCHHHWWLHQLQHIRTGGEQ